MKKDNGPSSALCYHFLSQEMCFVLFKNLFEEPWFELCIIFMSEQVHMSQEILQLTKKDDRLAIEVAQQTESLS
jgi:hypothetical protein